MKRKKKKRRKKRYKKTRDKRLQFSFFFPSPSSGTYSYLLELEEKHRFVSFILNVCILFCSLSSKLSGVSFVLLRNFISYFNESMPRRHDFLTEVEGENQSDFILFVSHVPFQARKVGKLSDYWILAPLYFSKD